MVLKGRIFPPGGGVGFGLGYAVLLNRGVAATLQTEWAMWFGGAYFTRFWIDQTEELIGILMSQIRPNKHVDFDLEFRNLVCQAIVD